MEGNIRRTMLDPVTPIRSPPHLRDMALTRLHSLQPIKVENLYQRPYPRLDNLPQTLPIYHSSSPPEEV